MKKNLHLLAIGLLGLGIAVTGTGCGSTDSTKEPAAETKPAIPIPADSPFAKIKIDMSQKEVYDLIGPPTDTSAHITGKQFIPYYYGGDTHRVESIYKGQGRIIFAPPHAFTSDLRVLEIHYDPSERGYN